jgi:hypothetical protein
MPYRFTQGLVGPDYAFRTKDIITDELPAETIARCVERGILVPIDEPVRAPEKQKATSRRQKGAEKAVL